MGFFIPDCVANPRKVMTKEERAAKKRIYDQKPEQKAKRDAYQQALEAKRKRGC